MNFEELSDSEKTEFAKLIFKPLSSSMELKNWVRLFLDLEIPLEITDPDSTSSPLDAIWQVYNTFKNNTGDVNPGYIWMSCREGMKTVSTAILETLLMMHFQLDIGHAAATEEQSSVCLGYIEDFLLKVEPFMLYVGWTVSVKNKRLFKYKTPEKKRPFIKIVICTPKGMNSLHSNVLFLDELDLADPKALKEGVNITGFSKGIHGVKVYLSTRKYAFGNMTQAMDDAKKTNFKIINWNILDVTEACPTSRHKPLGPKRTMYVAKNMPLQKITQEEFSMLPAVEVPKWEMLADVHEGCQSCALLPVCKMRLASKPQTATGGFYKPIQSVIQKFAENDPDTAEAQLMCWKPGSTGLVYPRFTISQTAKLANRNICSVREAFEALIGPIPPQMPVNDTHLLNEMKKAGIVFCAGVDWGYTHPFVICVVAVIPNGEIWLMETFASPGLEFPDMLDVAITFRDKYQVQKWFVDQAYPAHIKSFRKNGMPCPKFTKDVLGGIEAVRSKILGGMGKRWFKVIDDSLGTNKKAVTALQKHRFVLDQQGNPTLVPDDTPGIADICDALRYVGQNLFPVRGPQRVENVWIESAKPILEEMNNPEQIKEAQKKSQHEAQMKAEISRLVGGAPVQGGSGKKGGFFYNF